MPTVRLALLTSAALLVLVGIASTGSAEDSSSWPQWRGSQQNGVASGTSYPIEWSEQKGVRWKQPLPGLGGSTPVLAGGNVYVTSGVEGQNTLIAIDANSGQT